MTTKPLYRVRLFLSVDLTGSTAFKQQKTNTLEWVKAFQVFYSQFPLLLARNYIEICKNIDEIDEVELNEGAPKLWKTVGDEILFCCRLHSQCHLSAAISSFISTLIQFGDQAKQHNLNTKGNAWIGSFPSPNCSIMAVQANLQEPTDPLYGAFELPSEEREAEVDKDPSKFDFLGKGIDAGFRISRNSAIDALTISPGLGILLAQAEINKRTTKFECAIRLSGMQIFKGVANNEPYPVLTIDTSRDQKNRDLLRMQRDILGEPAPPQSVDLERYLQAYLEMHKIEEPVLKLTYKSAKLPDPSFYNEYCISWDSEKEILEQNYEQAAKQDDDGSAPINMAAGEIADALQAMLNKIIDINKQN